jgi:CheY-like chemotaxis protein
VAFIDIGLPGGMDGYELARRIRNHPLGRDVRLVALTGYGFPEDRQQSKMAGFARHLVKPVEPEALQRELNAAPRRAN